MDDNERVNHPAGISNESLGDTITGIVEDLQNVVRGEVRLAKTEIKEDVSKLGQAAGMIAGAAVVGLTGLIIFMLGVTYLLDLWIDELWISAGIVGIVLLIIAAVAGMSAKSKIQGLKPDDTIQSVKEDQQWASQQINSVRK